MKQIIYQAMARLWGNGHFSAWNNKTFAYLSSLGVDYLWLTGIPRHASGKSFVKGNPGCPYSVTDWKDVNPYMADNEEERVHEFELLVRRAHRNGIKILTDFIPNHVACDYHGGMKQYGYCDGDWTDTLKNDWRCGSGCSSILGIAGSRWISLRYGRACAAGASEKTDF